MSMCETYTVRNHWHTLDDSHARSLPNLLHYKPLLLRFYCIDRPYRDKSPHALLLKKISAYSVKYEFNSKCCFLRLGDWVRHLILQNQKI